MKDLFVLQGSWWWKNGRTCGTRGWRPSSAPGRGNANICTTTNSSSCPRWSSTHPSSPGASSRRSRIQALWSSARVPSVTKVPWSRTSTSRYPPALLPPGSRRENGSGKRWRWWRRRWWRIWSRTMQGWCFWRVSIRPWSLSPTRSFLNFKLDFCNWSRISRINRNNKRLTS